MTCFNQ